MGKEDVGITVSKNEDFSEWYTQVVLKAKLADYAPVKGLIVLRPDGYSIWESLRSTFDKKFSRNGIRKWIFTNINSRIIVRQRTKTLCRIQSQKYFG